MAKARRGFNFDMIEVKKPNYSKFNLSHDHLCALGSGKLVPIWWTESVPGDLWKVNISSFVRLLALSSPMLQREDIFIRAFKVPERILADRKDQDLAWTGGKIGDHINFPFGVCNAEHMKVGSLYDYLNLPLPYIWDTTTKSWKFDYSNVDDIPSVSIFPFLAYHRIYHDHFRNEETEDDFLDLFDQKYSDLDNVDLHDSPEASFGISGAQFALDDLHSVCWERDYFTSALSRPQRGNQVSIPLVGQANVVGTDTPPAFTQIPGGVGEENLVIAPNGQLYREEAEDPLLWHNTGLVVDGSSFTGIGAIALRMAMNLQTFLERNNVAGYRMIGQILAHFGVHSSNKQFDEAEYLGGIKAPITISAVNQTSASAAGSTPQGNQVGTAQSAFSGHLFSTYVEEPSIIMVVAYINAKSSYSQGLSRKWTRRTYLDRYWPEFQTIGEQEVLNQEVYYDFYHGQDEPNKETWAYQSRYSEFKYEPDTIAGDFRTTLSYWHQSRLFTSMPSFNDDFVKSNPSDRVFAVNTATYPRPYLGEFYFDIQAVRPMSKYAQSKLW